jgi:hypothetical protein
MRHGFPTSAGSRKAVASLVVACGLTSPGCTGEAQRSEAAKQQLKQVAESESKLLKQKDAKGLRKGVGGPKSIKGKLGDLEKATESGS